MQQLVSSNFTSRPALVASDTPLGPTTIFRRSNSNGLKQMRRPDLATSVIRSLARNGGHRIQVEGRRGPTAQSKKVCATTNSCSWNANRAWSGWPTLAKLVVSGTESSSDIFAFLGAVPQVIRCNLSKHAVSRQRSSPLHFGGPRTSQLRRVVGQVEEPTVLRACRQRGGRLGVNHSRAGQRWSRSAREVGELIGNARPCWASR